MQQTQLLDTLSKQQPKIIQLNIKLRKWRFLTFLFMASTIILSFLLINNYNQQSRVQSTPQVQSTLLSDGCSIIELNNTNLTEFSIKMQFSKTKQISDIFKTQTESTSKITSLDLSSNLLQKFSDNSLPDLQKLNLTQNQIKTFSSNVLPKLNNFQYDSNLFNMSRFQNNSLPLINFNRSIINTNYFNYNYMPSLNNFNSQVKFTQLKELIGNTLSFKNLSLQINEQSYQFYNNSLDMLQQLLIECIGKDHIPISSNKFNNNQFKNLKSLVISCNLLDFYQSINFQKLQQLHLGFLDNKKGGLQQLTNLSFPEMNLLDLYDYNGSSLKAFTYNKLPKLKSLRISLSNNTNLTDICTGNQMPNLEALTIYSSKNKLNLNCFSNLSNLWVFHGQVKQSIQGMTFSNVSQFLLKFSEPSILFANNSFPMLESFNAYNLYTTQSFKNSNHSFDINILYWVTIQRSNIKQFSFEKDMTRLTYLSIRQTNLQIFNCSTMKNLNFLDLCQNKLKDNIIDVLIQCNFKKIANIYLQDNLIIDKTAAKAKLSKSYPTAYISI